MQRGDEIVVATAPRGNGLDRNANIKSCSKSIVALLLGTAIEKGEIADIKASLQSVAPGIIPADATEGVAGITIEELRGKSFAQIVANRAEDQRPKTDDQKSKTSEE